MARPTEVRGLGPPTDAGAAGALLVTARLADVRRHEDAVAERLDVDAIHDMRVATRRLRAALKVFGAGARDGVDAELKRLQDALGAVRDVQVQLDWLSGHGRALRGPEAAELRAWIAAPLDRDAAALRIALARWKGEGAARVEAAAAGVRGGRKLGGGGMERRLAKRVRRVARLSREVREGPEPGIAHELRIAAKKLRYTAELLEPAFPRRVEALLGALVPLQETLGDLHDADVRMERLRSLAEGGTAVERRAALKLLEPLAPERQRLAARLVRELSAVTAW